MIHDAAFKCPFCPERAYAQKGGLTKHIKQKHVGNNIYNCESCNEAFQYYADLKTHSFQHYKEEKAKQESMSVHSNHSAEKIQIES